MKLWFGKYRGCEVSAIPESYLCWLIDNAKQPSLRNLAQQEINRRTASRHSQPQAILSTPLVREIISAGFKQLAMKYHPDHGGDVSKMQQLNRTMAELRERLG